MEKILGDMLPPEARTAQMDAAVLKEG
jgi:hypothetical protein